jgi:hypothetical protein
MQTTTLYEQDFYAWTQHQVELLRSGKFEGLDIDNLVEEIDSLGKQQRQELPRCPTPCIPPRCRRSWHLGGIGTVNNAKAVASSPLTLQPLHSPNRFTLWSVYPPTVYHAL